MTKKNEDLLDAGSPNGTLMWTHLQYACAVGDMKLVQESMQKQSINQLGSVCTS